MGALESKSLDRPESTQEFAGGMATGGSVSVGGVTVGRSTVKQGWRWSEHIKPEVGGDLCKRTHAGYAVSGRLTVENESGDRINIGPGDAYWVEPGHDAWVEGDEAFVSIEFDATPEGAKW